MIVRFVFLRVESHVLQPLVERHVSILNVRHQVIHKLAILRPRSPIFAVLVGPRALRSRESLAVRPWRLCDLWGALAPDSRQRLL